MRPLMGFAASAPLMAGRMAFCASAILAGATLQASIDRHGRLVLVPSRYEPQELFLNRPRVDRVLSIDEMDRAIASATSRENP